jgi:hypothetical protein
MWNMILASCKLTGSWKGNIEYSGEEELHQ